MYKQSLAFLHGDLINEIRKSPETDKVLSSESLQQNILRTELRKFASDGLHELLQLGQGVPDENPELSFRQGFVRLVPQKVESSTHQVSRLEKSSPNLIIN